MTREEIEKLSTIEPYCFETDREEIWFEIGCIDGLNAADEEPDTTKLWHDASEEPKTCSEVLIYFMNEYGKMACRLYRYIYWTNLSWKDVVDLYHIKQWAYISDLLPKEINNETENSL